MGLGEYGRNHGRPEEAQGRCSVANVLDSDGLLRESLSSCCSEAGGFFLPDYGETCTFARQINSGIVSRTGLTKRNAMYDKNKLEALSARVETLRRCL